MAAEGQHLSYCGALVRDHDPDRFLLTLLMPPQTRAALWALFAFNHEIARTREVVSETTLGLIRLQWWRDALARIYDGGEPPQNEILPALAAAIRTHDLPKEDFDTLLYAREFDLENVPPASMAGLENYADFTHAPLLRLALKAAGEEDKPAAIRAVAVAYAMTGLLRAVPFHATQRRVMMPADLMVAQAVSERLLYEMKPGAGFTAVTRQVAERADHLLRQAKPRTRLLKLTRTVVDLYLAQIRGAGGDMFSARLGRPPAFFHLRLWLRSLGS